MGSAAIDITARADPVPGGARSNNNLHTTTPGVVSLTSGGVGRNVAEAAHRILSSFSKDLASSAVLVSPVGQDAFGKLLQSESERIGMRTDGLIEVTGARTAVCNMVLDSAGGLTGGVADMDIIRTLDVAKVSMKFAGQVQTRRAYGHTRSSKLSTSTILPFWLWTPTCLPRH